MRKFEQFKISFSELKEGKHKFFFPIDKAFFDAFGYTEFKDLNFDVKIEMDKGLYLKLNFFAKGYITTPCDLTGENFNLNIEDHFSLLVKFGHQFDNEGDGVLILPHHSTQLELQQYIYELIVLAIPQKRLSTHAKSVRDVKEFF